MRAHMLAHIIIPGILCMQYYTRICMCLSTYDVHDVHVPRGHKLAAAHGPDRKEQPSRVKFSEFSKEDDPRPQQQQAGQVGPPGGCPVTNPSMGSHWDPRDPATGHLRVVGPSRS